MKIIKTSDFQRTFSKISKEIQGLYKKQEKRLLENCKDPRLHIKKVRFLEYALSFRITSRYRVFFYF